MSSTRCVRLTLPSPTETRWGSIGQPRFACAGCATSSATCHRVSLSRTTHFACAATREPFRWPTWSPLLRRVAQPGQRERFGTARLEVRILPRRLSLPGGVTGSPPASEAGHVMVRIHPRQPRARSQAAKAHRLQSVDFIGSTPIAHSVESTRLIREWSLVRLQLEVLLNR
jgi:hypothetical protein